MVSWAEGTGTLGGGLMYVNSISTYHKLSTCKQDSVLYGVTPDTAHNSLKLRWPPCTCTAWNSVLFEFNLFVKSMGNEAYCTSLEACTINYSTIHISVRH